MKPSWRLAIEPKNLWAKVLKMKCYRGNNDDNMKVSRQASNAWKGIMDNIHLTKEGVRHAIGDGRRTKFWTQKWIDGMTLLSQAISEVLEEQQLLDTAHRMGL